MSSATKLNINPTNVCGDIEEVFNKDGEGHNLTTGGVIVDYNNTYGSNISLKGVRAVYDGRLDSIEERELEEIRAHISNLASYAQTLVARASLSKSPTGIVPPGVPDEEWKWKGHINDLIQTIRDRCVENLSV